jgi:hypothetical protein
MLMACIIASAATTLDFVDIDRIEVLDHKDHFW